MKEPLSATHAVAKDFCRIFEQDMDRLYLLSLLLTADHSLAERCFVGGLEDSARCPRGFKEWASSWARRMVVQNAIRTIRPQAGDSRVLNQTEDRNITSGAELAAILELPAFERFVFVMSVLERYSDRDCALLLDCTGAEVAAARERALRRLGDSAESQGRSASAVPGSGGRLTQEVAGLLLTLVPRLVPSV